MANADRAPWRASTHRRCVVKVGGDHVDSTRRQPDCFVTLRVSRHRSYRAFRSSSASTTAEPCWPVAPITVMVISESLRLSEIESGRTTRLDRPSCECAVGAAMHRPAAHPRVRQNPRRRTPHRGRYRQRRPPHEYQRVRLELLRALQVRVRLRRHAVGRRRRLGQCAVVEWWLRTDVAQLGHQDSLRCHRCTKDVVCAGQGLLVRATDQSQGPAPPAEDRDG